MPVGRCVMRTAESVLLTCWPPAPDARNVSMRMSAGLIVMSAIGSASGSHGDRARRRVDASLRFGLGHALHAMAARLELELRIHALPDDAHDHFLVAAQVARRLRHDLDLPAAGARRSACTSAAGRRRTARTRRRRCRRGFRRRRCARRSDRSAAAHPATRASSASIRACAAVRSSSAKAFIAGRAPGRRRPRGRPRPCGSRDRARPPASISERSFDSAQAVESRVAVPGADSRASSSDRRASSCSSFSRNDDFIGTDNRVATPDGLREGKAGGIHQPHDGAPHSRDEATRR